MGGANRESLCGVEGNPRGSPETPEEGGEEGQPPVDLGALKMEDKASPPSREGQWPWHSSLYRGEKGWDLCYREPPCGECRAAVWAQTSRNPCHPDLEGRRAEPSLHHLS